MKKEFPWTDERDTAWKCFVGEGRLLKFPTFIHVCAALDENRTGWTGCRVEEKVTVRHVA